MKHIYSLASLLVFLSAGTCYTVRDCVVSVPVPNKTPKTYDLTFNTTILREAEIVLTHKPFCLAENSGLIGLLKELYNSTKNSKPVDLTKFFVLKETDWSGAYGSMIVKLKNNTYVAKLFRVNPANFGMGTGLADLGMWLVNRVNRFMLGFTRLSNRARLASWFKKPDAKKFKDRLILPSKKLWIPAGATWITVSWTDSQGKKQTVKIPDTYIVLCDCYEKSRELTKQEEELVFELIKNLPSSITVDPNPSNFFVDKNNKIVCIDTENIDYTVGAHLQPTSYSNWLVQLVVSSINTTLISACCELG